MVQCTFKLLKIMDKVCVLLSCLKLKKFKQDKSRLQNKVSCSPLL